MTRTRDVITELKQTLPLALPIMAGQLTYMLMGLADTVMVGHVGTVPLAACAFVNAYAHIGILFGMGVVTSVAVQVSHAHGAGDEESPGEVLRHGMALALVGGVLIGALYIAGIPLLPWLGQPAEVIAAAIPYLCLIAVSIPFAIGTTCAKNFAEAQSAPWPALWIQLGGAGLNVFLNWLWIFGQGGFPAMGLEGAGWATLVARVLTFFALGGWIWTEQRFALTRPARWWGDWQPREFLSLLRMGAPVGGQWVTEVGAFGVAALMMGWIGTVALAAHQIALTCAATTFMVPLGLSMALTIRIGHVLGSGQPDRVRAIGVGGWSVAVCVMGSAALVFLLAGGSIAKFFTSDPAVIQMAISLLAVAGIFQLSDGIQVVSIGSLRGLKDVRIPSVTAFLAYWMIALPLAGFLGFQTELGASGVWAGLAIGLTLVALILGARFWCLTRRVS